MTLLEPSPARLPVNHAAKGSLATSSPRDPQAGVESVKAARRAGEQVLTECLYCGKFTCCPMDHGPGRCIADIFAEDA